MENGTCDSTHEQDSNNGVQVYLVPYRWLKDALDATNLREPDGNGGVLYTASQASSYASPMKLINNIFSSDIAFNLKREDGSSVNCDSNAGISGLEFALVPGEMWLDALKWHTDTKHITRGGKTFSAAEDDTCDVYPLYLRLSILRESNSLGVRVSKKENSAELFRRACKIFSAISDLLHIWDFSGQTTLYLSDDRSKLPKDLQRQQDVEILLELQVYGLSDKVKSRNEKRVDAVAQLSNGAYASGTSLKMNGSTGNVSSSVLDISSSSLLGWSENPGSLGLAGLQNLGNTCFMNSAIQCLAHTPKLVDYFLGDYASEINLSNPLGMEGEIALAFGDLLRLLWAARSTPVAPQTFKLKLARFAPQFSGYNQHDSQELLSFLLDGLHEDLNRVKSKPYIETKDEDSRPDAEVADEYWQIHLARNDSIIVDVFQGQYKSTLVCPICKKISITFDPFMYLSLPLPSTISRTMTLTVLGADGSSLPSPCTTSVPKYGTCEDLVRSLRTACALGTEETLLLVEVYNNRIIRYLEDPTSSLSLIRDGDRLIAYRLPKVLGDDFLVVFMHQRMEGINMQGKPSPICCTFEYPLVGSGSRAAVGSDLKNLYLKLLSPFRKPAGCQLEDSIASENCSAGDALFDDELKFYLTDEKGMVKGCEIFMEEALPVRKILGRLYVLVCWPRNYAKQYDTHLLSHVPEIRSAGPFAKRPQESVSLYNCLETFLKEEPLGPEDMWYCPNCKKHCQASKKLDLWRLPKTLVIHLKRFSYTRFFKNKLESYVDFPVDNLDLSSYVSFETGKLCGNYMLYAISNHYGSLGDGHYTAFVHHAGDRWYEFDDSQVYPISQDKIKTSAAYVLFYRRID